MRIMNAVAVLLMVVLVSQPISAVAQTQTAIKAQLDKIPIGKKVEVKLLRKDNNKIKGKLMSVSSESFEVQTTQSGKELTEKIAFTDVKSVKKSGMSTTKKVLIVTGIVVACAIVLSIIAVHTLDEDIGF
jgi:hypothetical protein